MAKLGYWNHKRCKYGKLKNPNMKGRVCRKRPCKYGKVKGGPRKGACRKHPRSSR